MTTRPAAEQAFLEAFERLSHELPGQGLPWIERLRHDAISTFGELGIPTTRMEDWRSTRLTALAETPFRPVAAQSGQAPSRASLTRATQAIGEAHRLVFLNGYFSAEHSDLTGLPSGVRIESLGHVLAHEPQRLEPHLARCSDSKTRAFTALNTAFASDGILVELSEGAELERPIHALFIQQAETTPAALHPRNLLVAGPGSRARLVEHYLGSGTGVGLTNAVTEVFAARDSRIEHVKLQEERPEAYHIAELHVRQEAGSHFTAHSLSLGAKLMRFDIQALLCGELAHCSLNGLYLGRDTQHVDHHTTIDHAMPHTTSDEVYRGILDGRAHGVFHGRIVVRPDAQKISAEQNNRNLLLSSQATINSKPQLEIYADDVRCTHGAAIGRLDEDALFYLQTRGIPLEDARAILTFGFASQLTRKLPVASLAEYIENHVLAWLPRGEAVR